MAHIRMVERFLQEWDPIEVIGDQVKGGVPPTEYDGYAPAILRMLTEGCSAEDLAEHLASLRADCMGFSRDDPNDGQIAEGLVRWWTDYGEERT